MSDWRRLAWRPVRRVGSVRQELNVRFASGNTTEDLRYFEQRYGTPWNELEVKCRPEDPNADCVAACAIEWGHSQTINKWAGQPAAEYDYNIKAK